METVTQTGRDQIFAHLVEREERICSTLLFVIRSAKHEFVTPNKMHWISWRRPGLENFQGMQQWSTKPEEACNCYPSRYPHLVNGIRTLVVPCAQWQQPLPLVECPLSALLRAFVPATRGITRDEQCSLPHVRSSVWHLRRNLLLHLST